MYREIKLALIMLSSLFGCNEAPQKVDRKAHSADKAHVETKDDSFSIHDGDIHRRSNDGVGSLYLRSIKGGAGLSDSFKTFCTFSEIKDRCLTGGAHCAVAEKGSHYTYRQHWYGRTKEFYPDADIRLLNEGSFIQSMRVKLHPFYDRLYDRSGASLPRKAYSVLFERLGGEHDIVLVWTRPYGCLHSSRYGCSKTSPDAVDVNWNALSVNTSQVAAGTDFMHKGYGRDEDDDFLLKRVTPGTVTKYISFAHSLGVGGVYTAVGVDGRGKTDKGDSGGPMLVGGSVAGVLSGGYFESGYAAFAARDNKRFVSLDAEKAGVLPNPATFCRVKTLGAVNVGDSLLRIHSIDDQGNQESKETNIQELETNLDVGAVAVTNIDPLEEYEPESFTCGRRLIGEPSETCRHQVPMIKVRYEVIENNPQYYFVKWIGGKLCPCHLKSKVCTFTNEDLSWDIEINESRCGALFEKASSAGGGCAQGGNVNCAFPPL